GRWGTGRCGTRVNRLATATILIPRQGFPARRGCFSIAAADVRTRKSTARRGVLALAIALTAASTFGAAPALAAPSGWLNVDGQERHVSGGGATHDWANSGTAPPAAGCPAGAVNVQGSGGIFNCGSPNGGSIPPNPATLTASAAADPSIISARFIVDPI